jgi:hypothetical protein
MSSRLLVFFTDHGVTNERERAILIESTIRAPKGCATKSAVADWSLLLWAEVSNITMVDNMNEAG